MNNQFLAMWDMNGLECLFNVTEKEKENVVRALYGEPIHRDNPIQYLILRARVNSQRHYEIYQFNSVLSEDEIREVFDCNPQVIVDAIRSIGHKIYSDRVSENKRPVIV